MGAFSKFQSLDYNCYEVGHTWTPSCPTAAASVAIDCFVYSTKVYTAVYVLALLLRRKRLTWGIIKRTLLDILQSTCFLTWNGFAFVSFICIFRALLGTIYVANAGFLPGFASSLMAILIERKSRRRVLAVYILNVILDAFYRMAVYRKLITPIPNGQVYLFSVSVAGFLYFYRKREDLHDITGKILQFLLGKEEGGVIRTKSPSEWDSSNKERQEKQNNRSFIHNLNDMVKYSPLDKYFQVLKNYLAEILNTLRKGPRHDLCIHKDSCHFYWMKAFTRSFLLGYGAQTILQLASSLPKIIRRPRLLKSQLVKPNSLKFGAFLGSFCAVFKMVSCILRWVRDHDDARHGIIAGIIAGLTMYINPMPSVALYTFCKLLEVLYLKGMHAKYLPEIPFGAELLYALVTGLMFHVAVLEPHNLRPSYWTFLIRLTATRIGEINRHLLEPFGTKSGLMFPNKLYNLDHQFTSNFLKHTMRPS